MGKIGERGKPRVTVVFQIGKRKSNKKRRKEGPGGETSGVAFKWVKGAVLRKEGGHSSGWRAVEHNRNADGGL